MNQKGTLYIVATPIGHLSDISDRALTTLRMVDVIACENRDRHVKLLNHYAIKKRTIEYSPANEKNSAKGIVEMLFSGQNVALVSDAGVPGLSDPGKVLVSTAREKGVHIVPIPGPSALTTLLSVSGFPCSRVAFLGFLPKTPGKQEKELRLFQNIETVVVLFSSQYHIKKILAIINKIYGNVEIIIGREMTKMNEEFLSGKLEDVVESEITEKGEFTLAFYNRPEKFSGK
jgi:16S rRNA (cytidine1402-2'-O)-methyltransferase